MDVLNIGSRRELFVDDFLLDTMDGAYLKLHEPVPMDTSIQIDKPWEGACNFGNTVFRANGKYYMYYRAMHYDTGPAPETHACLAVSEDGIHWEKPALTAEGENFVDYSCAFYDTRPGVPENERFKAFYSEGVNGEAHTPNSAPTGRMRLVFFASGDGIRYHKMDPQPKLESDLFFSFDGGNHMFWSEAEGQYVFYYRYCIRLTQETPEDPEWITLRTVARMTSKDFYTWSEPERMRFPTEMEQIYMTSTHPYYRAPHIYLAPSARFMPLSYPLPKERAERILPPEGIPFETAWKDGLYWDCSDGVLLSTRAGSNVYDRTFMEVFVRPGADDRQWLTRNNYPVSGFIPYDDKTMFLYVNRNYEQDSWHIERLALRVDGFASLYGPWKGGVAVTKPFLFEGSTLEINYRTAAAGEIRIEVLDADGNVMPGFQKNMCEKILGNEISHTVRWRSDYYPGYELSKFAGIPIRLRFHLKDADIFSLKFNP